MALNVLEVSTLGVLLLFVRCHAIFKCMKCMNFNMHDSSDSKIGGFLKIQLSVAET